MSVNGMPRKKTAVLLLEDNEFQQKKGSYFASAQQSSIINLLRMNPLQIGITKFKIRARITGIDLSSGWFYTACLTCGSGLQSLPTGHYCTVHLLQQPALIVKLPLDVKDDRARMKLIIFRSLAEELATISVADVPVLKDSSSIKIPNKAFDIINKEYYFVVGLPKHSLQKEELNFKIFYYKPVEKGDPTTTDIKGKAIELTSAPLLLTGTATDLALQIPHKSSPPIRSQHQQHLPPKHGEIPVQASQTKTQKDQKPSKKRVKPSSPKESANAANPEDSSSPSNSPDNRSPSTDAGNQAVEKKTKSSSSASTTEA
ncbi:Nucleic acid-binding protein [Corchorus capsularis]|uniref:Nucleic acid-binding protein n=1 Tax=Corchorus capsularis TaxID=210143 RepID=A0A1R3K1T8_COCAP|nr:Nucleic acid-binding protein [Corchorus capsularis]